MEKSPYGEVWRQSGYHRSAGCNQTCNAEVLPGFPAGTLIPGNPPYDSPVSLRWPAGLGNQDRPHVLHPRWAALNVARAERSARVEVSGNVGTVYDCAALAAFAARW